MIIPARDDAVFLKRLIAQLRAAREDSGLSIQVVAVVAMPFGRDDGTLAAAADADIVVQQESPSPTIAEARNKGAQLATGDLLLHTDADVVIPDPENFFASAFALHANGVDAFTGLVLPYPASVRRRDRTAHAFGNFIIRTSFATPFPLARGELSFVDRNVFVEAGGYREELALGEDCDLFRRLSRARFKMAFARSLRIHHSTRRFRADGYLYVAFQYVSEFAWLMLTGRPRLRRWRPVR